MPENRGSHEGPHGHREQYHHRQHAGHHAFGQEPRHRSRLPRARIPIRDIRASNGPDGDLTASVKVTELYGKTLPINTAMVGSYVLVYSVTNKTGTKSTSATRYVYVIGVTIDVTPPIITLNGAAACTVMVTTPLPTPA